MKYGRILKMQQGGRTVNLNQVEVKTKPSKRYLEALKLQKTADFDAAAASGSTDTASRPYNYRDYNERAGAVTVRIPEEQWGSVAESAYPTGAMRSPNRAMIPISEISKYPALANSINPDSRHIQPIGYQYHSGINDEGTYRAVYDTDPDSYIIQHKLQPRTITPTTTNIIGNIINRPLTAPELPKSTTRYKRAYRNGKMGYVRLETNQAGEAMNGEQFITPDEMRKLNITNPNHGW